MPKPISRSTGPSFHTVVGMLSKQPTNSFHIKISTFKSNILSTFLHGSKCWKTITTFERKIEVFQNKCLRCILNICWPNIITNEDLENRTLKRQSKRGIGNALECLPYAIQLSSKNSSTAAMSGKRKRGWLRELWRQTIQRDLKSWGLTLHMALRTAADRARWRPVPSPHVPNSTERTEWINE